MKKISSKHVLLKGESYLLCGLFSFLVGLGVGLVAYYVDMMFLRYMAFSFIVSGILFFLFAFFLNIKEEQKTGLYSFVIVLGLSLLYFILRWQVHRFDFGVGDAADYYVAGVCSVTYGQDIGFFLPLTASVSALGFSIFGSAYAPYINVIVYFSTIPLAYFILRAFGIQKWIAIFMTLFFVVNPLSIWFSKSSFSEPIWQLLLLIFLFVWYRMAQREHLKIIDISLLYGALALVPFVRGEGAIYFGLLFLLILYHFWQYKSLKSASILILGLFVLAGSIHITVGIREHYLLGWQFSRIIPDITPTILMSILYGGGVVVTLLMYMISFGKNVFTKLPFGMIVTLLVVVFKVVIAYIYSQKREPTFLDYLFVHEYELALGNFGLPLTLLIGLGLVLLHIRAFKEESLALVLVSIYAVFFLPLVMQGVTFYDPHEVFLYWNRYYFSVLMMVHLFALALSIQFMFDQLSKIEVLKKYIVWLVGVTFLVITFSSLNLNVAQIVVKEAYLENSDKVFTWVKRYVGRKNISVLYDDSIRYERHNGLYDVKVFVSRMFTVRKIYAKAWQKVKSEEFKSDVKLDKDLLKTHYLVSFSTKKNRVKDKRLKVIAKKEFHISWREHYRAQPRSGTGSSGDVSKSYKNELPMQVTIYQIISK